MDGFQFDDEDLCGRNVALLQSTVLRELIDITTDIEKHLCQ